MHFRHWPVNLCWNQQQRRHHDHTWVTVNIVLEETISYTTNIITISQSDIVHSIQPYQPSIIITYYETSSRTLILQNTKQVNPYNVIWDMLQNIASTQDANNTCSTDIKHHSQASSQKLKLRVFTHPHTPFTNITHSVHHQKMCFITSHNYICGHSLIDVQHCDNPTCPPDKLIERKDVRDTRCSECIEKERGEERRRWGPVRNVQGVVRAAVRLARTGSVKRRWGSPRRRDEVSECWTL